MYYLRPRCSIIQNGAVVQRMFLRADGSVMLQSISPSGISNVDSVSDSATQSSQAEAESSRACEGPKDFVSCATRWPSRLERVNEVTVLSESSLRHDFANLTFVLEDVVVTRVMHPPCHWKAS